MITSHFVPQVPGQQGFQSSESVDETMDGLFFNRLENLPVPSSHGCLVALDENRLFFAGGRRNDGETSLIDRAAIYNRLEMLQMMNCIESMILISVGAQFMSRFSS